MRAVVCREFGTAKDLQISEIGTPDPQPGEVLMDNHVAALNFPDTLAIAGKYQIRAEPPFVPGGEAAGTVVAVGDGVTDYKPGDRVISVGSTGAFAEQQCVPAAQLTLMPDNMDFATGAGFLVTYGTSLYALRQCGHLQAAETLVVLGAAGGVGLAAVDLGKAAGAKVIAAASSEDKLDVAMAAGADLRINYSAASLRDEIKELTDGIGADVIYDPVGGEYSEAAFRAMAWNGRFLVVGFAAGDIPAMPLNLPLLKNCSIKGVFYGAWAQREPALARENVAELFRLYATGKLHPLISQRFELADFKEAFAMLTERRAIGKLVLTIAH